MNHKKSILITGCSSGIGFRVAHDLQKSGYEVFASCRKSEDVTRLRTQGLQCVQLDVNESQSIEAALDYILNITDGRLDAVFNNAGFAIPGAVEDLSKSALLEQFHTNVFGLLELTNKIIPIMRKQCGGNIIVNSSILGFISLRYRGAYTASKHALEGLFDTLRLELMDTPIHVSIIQPGPIASQFRSNAYDSFMANIEHETSVHHIKYQHMNKHYLPKDKEINLDKQLQQHKKSNIFEQTPSAISKKIITILGSKRPRAYYSVTLPTYLFRLLVRIVPTVILDKILYRITKSETDLP